MAEVLIGVEGRVGRLTLNRPAALNALTLDMVRLVDMALSAWAGDPSISLVLVDAAGERAFCAGGDIRALYDAARSEEWDSLATFFREEYRLNAQIARFPKPIIALMDGLAMGGGIGLGSHASHRVVTERSSLAMPECRIGFIPDVGSTYLLGTAPGELGTHVALTGMRLDAADAIACGLADRLVRSSRLVELRARFGDCRSAVDVWRALDAVGEAPGPSRLATARSWIDRCYAGDSA
jgi:enoyl-CoA hydratase